MSFGLTLMLLNLTSSIHIGNQAPKQSFLSTHFLLCAQFKVGNRFFCSLPFDLVRVP